MKVLVILVLYKTTVCDSVAYNTLIDSINFTKIDDISFFVYDNSPLPHDYTNNNRISKYIHDPLNSGLSKAYNIGALYAKENNFNYILLSDQDTSFDKSFFKLIIEPINKNKDVKIFAPILILKNSSNFSPTLYKYKRGHPVSLIPNQKYSLNKYSPVNSGMLIDLDFYLSVGGYNEKVRLDFADFQFIERARKKTKYFYLVDTKCLQDFSNDILDVNALLNRFQLYCESAKNCYSPTVLDKVQYFYAVLRHALGLTIRTKRFDFIKIFFKKYLLRINK